MTLCKKTTESWLSLKAKQGHPWPLPQPHDDLRISTWLCWEHQHRDAGDVTSHVEMTPVWPVGIQERSHNLASLGHLGSFCSGSISCRLGVGENQSLSTQGLLAWDREVPWGLWQGYPLPSCPFCLENIGVFGIMTCWGHAFMGGGWVPYSAGYKYSLNKARHSILLGFPNFKVVFPSGTLLWKAMRRSCPFINSQLGL